ncbi:Uncharacterized protein (Fragment) OS=uncultured bacterium PE=4 SV=1 [Gemmata massiliana]|uniref:SMI1/KNR4 family protein n=1 Tax=Gemmata massiliana TaxID=1210884 RepID=A0A6P2CWL5_9BACT
MTEAEWLACDDVKRLLEPLRDRASARKLRLLACARAWGLSGIAHDPVCLDAIAMAERCADGHVAEPERDAVFRATCIHSDDVEDLGPLRWTFAFASAFAVGPLAGDIHTHITSVGRTPPNMELQPAHVRDIFGNPFRPAPFSPSWRTSTAVELAAQMYESRDFGALPILADALQDAGCDNADVLEHCRGPGPHVRGCWVVDLVLDKG